MFVVLQWIVAAASFKMFFGRTKRGKSRYDALNVSSSPEDVLELEVSVPLSSPNAGMYLRWRPFQRLMKVIS